MKEISKVVLNGDRDRITLFVVERDNWGVRNRFQMTLVKSYFEQALRDAHVEIPWREVTR